jgi:hypothetical protein
MSNLSSKKLWLSLDIELEWEMEQQTPSSSDLECNISFCHPYIVDRWDKLKRIKKTLQPIDFQVFTVVEKIYINEELKHIFLRMWR